MPDAVETSAEPKSATTAILERCLNAYRGAYQTVAASGGDGYDRRKAGASAYRLAMPSTESLASTQALIACVAQGINLQVYDGRESTQLLYAAQVALAGHKLPRPEKPRKAEEK